ncbi:cell division protein FtsL [Pseudohaliea rubra]|uniref:Cell division protein FtsL n=1 Tax=Pseudohaliea rubra DSM 19751 TaxID=1265313 RepID=A0A095VP49_9GAMM|nr:cell division protein FtsL [Pseudohaliea rubra]KGE03252.1 Cell division protein FtsL [Pseudohaliea rubra DSM 19751]
MAATRRQASLPASAKAAPPRGWRLALALLVLALGSSFSVVYATHECRQLYARLQDLEATRWYLDEEYSRLLLEQSTWASPHRVEQVAERDMAMAPPTLEQLRVLKR